MQPRDTGGRVVPIFDMIEIAKRIRDEEQAKRAADPIYREKAEREDAESEARVAAEESARKAGMKRDRREAAGIPKRLWAALDAPDDSEATDAVSNWISTKKTLLVLSGGVGCGKTFAATLALDRGHGLWTRAFDFVAAGMFGVSAEVLRAKVEDAELLVIDDMGTEPLDQHGYGLANIENALETRYNGAAKTIITTNLSASAFKARYGERIADRMREIGAWAEGLGTSRRKRT